MQARLLRSTKMHTIVDIVERLRATQPQDLGERSIVTGDLEQCLATLKKVEAAGISEVILYFNFGAYSHANTRRMMERFARDVMPHFTAFGKSSICEAAGGP